MTIDKAIEILEEYEKLGAECTHPKIGEAIQLGNNAMKRIQRLRKDALFDGEVAFHIGVSLPGESK